MKFLIAFLNKLIATNFVHLIFVIALAGNRRLCTELLWMAHRDQNVPKAWFRSSKYHTVERLKQLIQLDISNTARMKQIIAKQGWPGQSLVGPIGCQAAWLLVQHADHDSAFQKVCLGLLEKAVEENQAPASLLAYLTDRIRVRDGQSQIFGTQLYANLNPFPIEVESHIDERREKVSLPPLADYIDQVKQATAN
jgi:hypothetical protein